MERVYSYTDENGKRYAVPKSETQEFFKHVPQAQLAGVFRDTKGNAYAVPGNDAEMGEFVTKVPDARASYMFRSKAGKDYVVPYDEMGDFLKTFRSDDAFKEERDEIDKRVEELASPKQSVVWAAAKGAAVGAGLGLKDAGRGISRAFTDQIPGLIYKPLAVMMGKDATKVGRWLSDVARDIDDRAEARKWDDPEIEGWASIGPGAFESVAANVVPAIATHGMSAYAMPALYGLSRAFDVHEAAMESGHTPEQAITLAAGAGAIEGGMEYVSMLWGGGKQAKEIGKAIGGKELAGNARKVLRALAGEVLTEAGTEGIQEGVGNQYDQLAAGDDIDYRQSAVAAGMGAGTGAMAAIIQGGPTAAAKIDAARSGASAQSYSPGTSPQELAAWTLKNPEKALALAGKESPSRKDFEAAGLPRVPASERSRIAADLKELTTAETEQKIKSKGVKAGTEVAPDVMPGPSIVTDDGKVFAPGETVPKGNYTINGKHVMLSEDTPAADLMARMKQPPPAEPAAQGGAAAPVVEGKKAIVFYAANSGVGDDINIDGWTVVGLEEDALKAPNGQTRDRAKLKSPDGKRLAWTEDRDLVEQARDRAFDAEQDAKDAKKKAAAAAVPQAGTDEAVPKAGTHAEAAPEAAAVPAAKKKALVPPKRGKSPDKRGRTLRHFTTPERAERLRTDGVFSFDNAPIHGTGSLDDGPKTGRFAGRRIYLSLDDEGWGATAEFTPSGDARPLDMQNPGPDMDAVERGEAESFYDYARQQWMLRSGRRDRKQLEGVDVQIDDAARVLVIESPERLAIASEKYGALLDNDAAWDRLARDYDVVEIRNTQKHAGASKFFRAAMYDQAVVLNAAVAHVAGKPAEAAAAGMNADQPTESLADAILADPAKADLSQASDDEIDSAIAEIQERARELDDDDPELDNISAAVDALDEEYSRRQEAVKPPASPAKAPVAESVTETPPPAPKVTAPAVKAADFASMSDDDFDKMAEQAAEEIKARKEKAAPPAPAPKIGRKNVKKAAPPAPAPEGDIKIVEPRTGRTEIIKVTPPKIGGKENPGGKRVPRAIIESAAKHGVQGIESAAQGLYELFGANKRLGMGLTFDENTYAKAKPHFQDAIKRFSEAGAEVIEVFKWALNEFGEEIMPYLKRFKNELAEGKGKGDNNTDGGQNHDNAGDSTADQGRGEKGTQVGAGDRRPGSGDDAGGVGDHATEDAGGAPKAGSGEAAGQTPGGKGDGGNVSPDGGVPSPDGRAGAVGAELVSDGAGGGDAGGRPGGAASDDRGGGKAAIGVQPNYRIKDPESLVGGGPKTKFARNRQAIETYMDVRDAGRAPTEAERDAIAAYIGWGSFGQELFNGTWEKPAPKKGWEAEDAWLREHLGADEWKSAQSSIINAHYTNPPTVSAMWRMVRRMGFKGGRVLEPSMGIGNFFGLMPADLADKSDLTGIELDELTGGMAKMLYPQANISIKGYQESQTPDGFYDLVIGNWPFAAQSPADRRYNKLSPTLHDYFFLKALDQVRPGGLVVGITSAGTMDKVSQQVRLEMAKKGDLVASFRLPMGAFKDYAGTDVVTDIIILRKHDADKAGIFSVPSWVSTGDMHTPAGEDVRVNLHYHENPDHILGRLNYGTGRTSPRPGMIVEATSDFEQRLERAINSVPENAMRPPESKQERYVTNNSDDRVNSIMLSDSGELLVSLGEQAVALEDRVRIALKDATKTEKRRQQIRDLVGIRKIYGELIDQQREGSPVMEDTRKQLRNAYRKFVKQHGRINGSFALEQMKKVGDPNMPAMASLERNAASEGSPPRYVESTILTRSTTRPRPRPDVMTPSDAYVFQRNESLNFDLPRVAELSNTTEEAAAKTLLEAGAIFKLPSGAYEHADVYLSGNVRSKLAEAKAAQAEGIAGMERNIEAITKIMPEDVPYYNIEAKLGNNWVRPDHYQTFIGEMLGVSDAAELAEIDIRFSPQGWKVKLSPTLENRVEAKSNFGLEGIKFGKLVEHAMRSTPATVKTEDDNGNLVVDEQESEKANEKIATIQEHFATWVWKDPTRRVELEQSYNEIYNNSVPPQFSGDFLAFEGMMLERGESPFNLRSHQSNAIARGLISGRGIYAHEVGTGKTYTMAGIAIESRRYGKCKKPIIFAHNANSATVAAEINEMYPGAKVLYVNNLDKKTKAITLAQITNDDWDAIVVPHSMIDKFALRKETYNALAAEEIAELEAAAMDAAAEDGAVLTPGMMNDPESMKKVRSATAKELVKSRNAIIERINKMSQKSSEDAIRLEDAGIDMVLVDEAHEFKKPPIASSMRMKGLNKSSSDKSINMMFLLQYIAGINNGRGVHLFTGTPITNALNEMYNMMRFIMPKEMKDAGVEHWDSWFSTFAAETTDVEVTAAGDYQPVSRLASFVNVPELRSMVGQYMDVVFAEDMPEFHDRATPSGKKMNSPDLTAEEREYLLNGRTESAIGRPYKVIKTVVSEMTPEQRNIRATLMERSRLFRQMSKRQRREVMLSGSNLSPIRVESDATKAGLDARLFDIDIVDNPITKVNIAVKNVMGHFREHPLACQVIFMESGTSDYVDRVKKTRDDYGAVISEEKVREPVFNVAKDIINKLVEQGVPREQIALVSGDMSKLQRKAVADAMNTGKIRVVIGSTQTLGTGVNMQNNLRAMHHLDAPWRPGDLEQRNGRGHRQGNQWNSVMEYRYVTEGIDGRRWQVLTVKNKFIADFLRGRNTARIIEGDTASIDDDDAGGNDLTATLSEATGDPRILMIEKAKKDIDRLQRRERLFVEGQYETQKNIKGAARRQTWLKKMIEFRQAVSDLLAKSEGAPFSVTIDGKTYTKRQDAEKRLDAMRPAFRHGENVIGEYRGFILKSALKRATAWGVSEPKLIAAHPNFQDLSLDESIMSNGTLSGLDAALRNNKMYRERAITELADSERSVEHLTKSLDETFPQQAQLDKVISRLQMLEADVRINPVPPPGWLRQAAPIGSTVVYNGSPRKVAGHKYSDIGWFVMLEPEAEGAEVTDAPYMDVMDEQGIPIYEEHEFTPPEIGKAPSASDAPTDPAPQGGDDTQGFAANRGTYAVTPEQDAEYLAAVERGDMETVRRLLNEAIKATGVPILDDSASEAYSVRRSEPPAKTVKAFKLFATKPSRPGELFPLFVGSNEAVPQGVWLDAIAGKAAPASKTGKAKVKSKLGPLAFRPGWHAGDLPLATHIGVKNSDGEVYARRDNEVWAEVEMAADVDYQPQANATKTKDLDRMPENGLYRFKTNPNMTGQWIISGSMKVSRVLSQQEVDGMLSEKNLPIMPWENGPLDLGRLGLTAEQAVNHLKLAEVTRGPDGKPIPLSQRFDVDSDDILHAVSRPGAGEAARPGRNIGARRQDGGAVAAQPTQPTRIIDTIRKLWPGLSVRARATWTQKKAPGWYSKALGEMRLANAGDIIVAVHELGHHFDRELGGWSGKTGLASHIPSELIALGRDLYGSTVPKGGYRAEGFAEFIGQYLTGGDIQGKAPNLYHWFTTEYLPGRPKEAAKLRQLEDVIAQFQIQTPEQAVKALMSPRREDWSGQRIAATLAGIEAQTVDAFMPLLRGMMEAGANVNDVGTGKDQIRAKDHPYMLAICFARTAGGRALHALLENTTDLYGKANGESLKAIMAPAVDAGKVDELIQYWIAKRVVTRYHDHGLVSGLARDDAQAIIDKYASPEFDRIVEGATDWAHRELHLLVEAGAMTPAQFNEIVDMNPIYAPMMRQFLASEKRDGGKNKGLGKGVFRVRGGQQPIVDPLTALAQQSEKLHQIAMQHAVMRSLVQFYDSHRGKVASMGKFMSEVPAPREAVTFTLEKMKKTIGRKAVELGADPDAVALAMMDTWDEMTTIYRPRKDYRGGNNIIGIEIDGKRRFFEIQPDLFPILEGVTQSKFLGDGKIASVFRRATSLQRLGATGLNPAFGLIRNPLRDTGTAAVTADYHFHIPLLSTLSGMVMDIANSDYAKMYHGSGLDIAGRVGQDLRSARKAGRRVTAKNKVQSIARAGFIDGLVELLGHSEIGPRLMEYRGAFKHAKKMGWDDHDALVLAGCASKDVTVNFSRAGTEVRKANEVIMFANAGVQSLDKIGRSLGLRQALPWAKIKNAEGTVGGEVRARLKVAGRTTARALAFVTAAALANYLRNRDKDWWKKLPAFEKWNYLHVGNLNNDGPGFRIPLPFDIGAIFGALPVALLEERRTPGAFKEALEIAFENSMPIDIGLTEDDFRHKVAAVVRNFSLFTGAGDILINEDWKHSAIIPRYLEGLDPDLQYTHDTTTIGKIIGKQLGVAPVQVDHILNVYSGQLYKRAHNAVQTSIGNGDIDLSDKSSIPVIGTLFLRPNTSRAVEDFYERLDELERRKKSDRADDADLNELKAMKKVSGKLTGLWRARREALSAGGVTGRRAANEVVADVQALIEQHNERWAD